MFAKSLCQHHWSYFQDTTRKMRYSTDSTAVESVLYPTIQKKFDSSHYSIELLERTRIANFFNAVITVASGKPTIFQ